MSFAVAGTVPEPFVHCDNRGLVLSSGGRCVALVGGAQLMWAAETLDIIAQDGRATRSQHERVLGGFRPEGGGGSVVLFGGERGLLVSVELSSAAFDGLRRALGESQPRRHDR
jgi:hypothetical protein